MCVCVLCMHVEVVDHVHMISSREDHPSSKDDNVLVYFATFHQ